jgi:hypothetical protein
MIPMHNTTATEPSLIRRLIALPFDILTTLQSIDQRLAGMEKTLRKLDRAMDDNNHRRRMCVRVGSWND